MREHTTSHRRRPRRGLTLVRLVVVAGIATAPAVAEPAGNGTCPPSFECSPRFEALLAQGMEQSGSFRSLVEILGFHPEVSLRFGFARRRSDMRARSDLRVTFIYLTENGRQRRQNTGVSGQVTVPYTSYGHVHIGLIAHEFGHVLVRLHGGEPIAWDEEERQANEIEAEVLAELERFRAAERDRG